MQPITIHTVNLNNGSYWNPSQNGLQVNIGTLNVNRSITLVGSTISPQQPKATMNIHTINDTALDCINKSSIAALRLNATDALIQTTNITYQSCEFGGAGFETTKNNNAGGNSGTITWNDRSGTDYYWRGGDGNWNDPAHWAIGSFDGTPATCSPTALDIVHFDPATAGTVTLTTVAACREMDWPANPDKGGQLNGNPLSIFGNTDFSGATSVNVPLYFYNTESEGNDFTLHSGTTTYTQTMYFRHTGSYSLTSDLLSTGLVELNSGTLRLDGFTMDVQQFSSINSFPATAPRTVDLSNSTLISRYSNQYGIALNNSTQSPLSLLTDNSNLILYPFRDGETIWTHFYNTGAHFPNVTFNNYPDGKVVSLGYIGANSISSTFGNLTFNTDANFLSSTTVENLTLSPQRNYTMNNGLTITITGSLDPRTGPCDQIFLNGGTAAGQKATIVNKTGKEMSIPGGVLTRIYYTKDTDGSLLQVPNGMDNGENQNENITFTPRESQVFYWVGGTGNWTDPGHWAIGINNAVYNAGDYSAYNPGGCIPAITDTVYFNGNSFPEAGQTVTMDNPVQFASMIWLPEAGAQSPLLMINSITASGFIEFTEGVRIDSPFSGNALRISFTGTSTEKDAQKFDTRGVIYQGNWRSGIGKNWGIPTFSTGRYDWYGSFYMYQFAISNADWYTHGSFINTNGGGKITQSPDRIIDISNTTFEGTWIGPHVINECENFKAEGALFGYNNKVTFTNNAPCPVHVGSYINTTIVSNSVSGGPYQFISNGPSAVHFDKINFRIPSVNASLTGKIEVDSLSIGTNGNNTLPFRGSLNIGTTATDTVKILEYFSYPGTPCDPFFLQSATAGQRANWQLPSCNREDYYLHVRDINAILPFGCTSEDRWKVYGVDLGNNSGQVEFKTAPSTGTNNLPPLVASCNPYRWTVPGLMDPSTLVSTTWYKDGVKINTTEAGTTLGKIELYYDISQPGTYTVEVVYTASSGGCQATFVLPFSFATEFVWTAEGTPNDWNDPQNWNHKSVPDACSYVVIPGGLAHYPVLVPEDSSDPNPDNWIPAAVCDIIEFQFGGEVQNTHLLTYNSAKVDLQINSNQWYMLSTPLKNTYSGDYYLDTPNPIFDHAGAGMLVYMMHFHIPNYQTGAFIEYNWNLAFNTNDVEIKSGQGFALFANPRWSTGETNLLDGTPFRFPKYDAIHAYYNLYGNVTRWGDSLSRSDAGRFIYEDFERNIPADSLITLNHSGYEEEGQPIVVGNPFMTHLNFDQFYERNSALIEDEYKIAYGATGNAAVAGFRTYKKIGDDVVSTDIDPTLNQWIPPMQSFLVTSKTDTNDSLKVHVREDIGNAPFGSSTATLRSNPVTLPQLSITASRDAQKSKAVLVYWQEGDRNYYSSEDSRSLFDQSATEAVTVYLLSQDGLALDIHTTNDLNEMIPVGIRTSAKGKITLNISGMEAFAGQSVYLHDMKENRIIDLSETDEYTFSKLENETYLDNRFFIRFKTTTSIDRIDNPDVLVSNPEEHTIRVYSTQPLQTIEIVDVDGRIIQRDTDLPSSTKDYAVYEPGVYLVKVSGEQFSEIKKVIVK